MITAAAVAGTTALLSTAKVSARETLAEGGGNPPWFPSLMAFEHYDSARTKLFEQAHFAGSFTSTNAVDVRVSPPTIRLHITSCISVATRYSFSEAPMGRTQAQQGRLFFGGAYGADPGATGTFVARVDPQTLQPVWSNQLINTVETDEWNYPGVLSALQDGFLYQIYGYRLAKLNPLNGNVLGQIELPTLAAPRDTSYNGLDGWPDGTLVAKSVYRQAECEEQGFAAFLQCRIRPTYPLRWLWPSILIRSRSSIKWWLPSSSAGASRRLCSRTSSTPI
jgi:hypothetical protein